MTPKSGSMRLLIRKKNLIALRKVKTPDLEHKTDMKKTPKFPLQWRPTEQLQIIEK